jgi:hypothetical protein
MYYTIFQNYRTGNLWFKKYKTKAKQTRAVIGVEKLTYNGLYDNFTSLNSVKSLIKKKNKINKNLRS